MKGGQADQWKRRKGQEMEFHKFGDLTAVKDAKTIPWTGTVRSNSIPFSKI